MQGLRCTHCFTAISRKVVGKIMHRTIPKGNMGYYLFFFSQYTVPDTVAVISAVQIWFISYIINTHFFHRNIWTHNWPAPNVSGFIAQLVEHRIGIARSRVQTPLKSWIFFRLLYAIATIISSFSNLLLLLSLSNQTCVHGLSHHSLKNSELKTTHNTCRDCPMHFPRQPFFTEKWSQDRFLKTEVKTPLLVRLGPLALQTGQVQCRHSIKTD